ncbi:hypothetical protein SEUCBS140593_006103 [Sporothrix eucalyptigena]|uniref:Uncharacterized protein n=1 Tax=Sporothrix eucalyptigena TaxID=1812306 RepID=A0ABP0C1Z7_9PEZI
MPAVMQPSLTSSWVDLTTPIAPTNPTTDPAQDESAHKHAQSVRQEPASQLSLGPSAPGFIFPMTGYEFELNHGGNLRELYRQKQWAQTQLRSCNENNRFKHTQTTACIVAVNGHIIGPYSPDSLFCYGTNPEIKGLRVTEEGSSGNVGPKQDGGRPGGGNDDHPREDGGSDAAMPIFRKATLVLKHQVIVAVDPHNRLRFNDQSNSVHQCRPYQMTPSKLAAADPAQNTATFPSCAAGRTRADRGDSFGSSRSASANTGMSIFGSTSGPPATVPTTTPAAAAGRRVSHQSTQRYLFATTTIPLHAGVASRPGYRPVNASAAVERMRLWGGQPDRGVFGNAWLVHMAIDPGHVQHVVDTKVMEQVVRYMGRNGGSGSVSVGGASPVQTMYMVNEYMTQLMTREGTLSVLLSNHLTQKRIARQCPDLVAMWVMAQENL